MNCGRCCLLSVISSVTVAIPTVTAAAYAIIFSILLAVQRKKLMLRTTAVSDCDLMQMATAHSKSTAGMAAHLVSAILADKFHWTVSDEPIGNGNTTELGFLDYTRPWALPSVVYIR